MKRLGILVLVALVGAVLFGGSAFAAVSSKTQAHSTTVDVLFEGSASTTYYLYRHTKADDRNFQKIGTAALNATGDGFSSSSAEAGDTWQFVRPDINSPNYAAYTDNGLTDGEEYYYFVTTTNYGTTWGDTEAASTLDSEIVTSAFPPTQTRHGSYTEFTGACTGCHGLHSAKSNQKLLKGPTVADLCATCHDGTGSKYNEVSGLLQLSNGTTVPLLAGPFGKQLKAGMGYDDSASSAHNIFRDTGPVSAQVWQAPGSGFRDNQPLNNTSYGSGTDFSPIGWGNLLSCISCHEPHNRPTNFRLLRNDINEGISGNTKTGDGDYGSRMPIRGVSQVDVQGIVYGGALLPSYYAAAVGTDGKLRVAQTKYLNNTAKFCSQCHRAFYSKAVLAPIDRRIVDKMIPMASESTRNFIVGCFKDYPANWGGSCMSWVTSWCSPCHGINVNGTTVVSAAGTMENQMIYVGPATGNANLDTAAGASLSSVFGEGHRHPTEVPVRRILVSEKYVDGPSISFTITTTNAAMGPPYGIPTDRLTRVKDGPVNIGVPLEGNSAGSSPQTYANNRVVCLSCHMAHGSRLDPVDPNWSAWYVGDKRVETAYDQSVTVNGGVYGLNNLVNTGGGYFADYNGNGVQDSGEPAVVQGASGYYVVNSDFNGDGRPDKEEGVSTVLARFTPMAGVCYRCHSTK